MDARRDAGLAAAAFTVAAHELVVRDFPGCVATVGDLHLAPGAFNVVPGAARLSLEFRALDSAALDALEAALLDRAGAEAESRGVELDIERVGRWEPTALDPRVRAAVERAAAGLDLETMELPSGAGHDAQALAGVVPSGMIFVPSDSGISHDPREHMPWDDCINGANTLLCTALAYAGRGA